MATNARLLLLLLVALLLPVDAAAQRNSATLVLRVLAHGTEQPIAGAQVRVGARGPGTVSDANGYARVTGIRAGSQVVEIRLVGYRTERLMVDFAARGVVEGEVELEVEPVALDPVEVTADSEKRWLAATGFYDRQKYFPGTFVAREEIDELAKNSLATSALLQRRLPGVKLQHLGQGRGYAIQSIRSSCYVQVLIDGVKMPGEQILSSRRASGGRGINVETTGVDIDRIVPIDQIEGIEWYLGPVGVPPQFNQTGSREGSPTCGTLVIWTRRGP